MTAKHRRRRLRSLQWSVAGVWLAVAVAIAFLDGLIVLDGMRSSPEFDGLREAHHFAGVLQLAVALAWFVTWLPILPIRTRVRGLQHCRVLIAATGAVWILWVLIRVRK